MSYGLGERQNGEKQFWGRADGLRDHKYIHRSIHICICTCVCIGTHILYVSSKGSLDILNSICKIKNSQCGCV